MQENHNYNCWWREVKSVSMSLRILQMVLHFMRARHTCEFMSFIIFSSSWISAFTDWMSSWFVCSTSGISGDHVSRTIQAHTLSYVWMKNKVAEWRIMDTTCTWCNTEEMPCMADDSCCQKKVVTLCFLQVIFNWKVQVHVHCIPGLPMLESQDG